MSESKKVTKTTRTKTASGTQSRMNLHLKLLKKSYPDSRCSLFYQSPFQLLVATVLSAQCTDDRVNKVTPVLFKKYPDAKSAAQAKLGDIEKIIRSTGFFKSKAKSIKALSEDIIAVHGGNVPQQMEHLVKLRGVGRKTANVVLGEAFGIHEGIVVDTHVGRLARRMEFTKEKDPVKVEKDLVKLVPRKDWSLYSHLMIDHGRALCMARSPNCEECFLRKSCPKIGV